MRISLAVPTTLLLASVLAQAPGYAQALPPGQPYIQVPIPGIPGVGQQPPAERGYRGDDDREHREHCERLRDREDEMRDRLETAYGEERQRLEYRIREVHEERERCWHR